MDGRDKRPMYSEADSVSSPDRAAVAARPGLWALWRAGVAGDLGRYPPPVALLHGLRRLRVLLAPAQVLDLCARRSLGAHAAQEGGGDPLFCLSHRHYLARGLPARARLAAAACHYAHQDRAFREAAFHAVHLGGGVPLWQAGAGGTDYDIMLQRGRDVAYEGGLSLSVRSGGETVCILSFSLVPGGLFPGADLPPQIWFLTRKHLTMNHAYQPAFHRAFHRVTAAQMAMAAFAGMARAMGHPLAVGIGGARHPANEPARAAQFDLAYDQFWQALGASPLGPDHLIPLPLPQKPLETLDPAHRKRVRQRRAVLQTVEDSAAAALGPMLRRG